MYIGIPKESRPFEYRVGLSTAGVEMLAQSGHQIFVEHDAGLGAGFSDQEYERAGARVAYSAEEVFGRADLLLKIARPLKKEMEWLKEGSILAGLLHLPSSSQDQIDILLEKKVTALAYEQITDASGALTVLRPFSLMCGAMVPQIAACLLQNNWGGKGILLSGLPGVPSAEVVIIGGGVVGMSATQAMLGAGAQVTVIDKNLSLLEKIAERFPRAVTMISTKRNIERATAFADVVIGAVLVSGQRAPIVVTREMVCGTTLAAGASCTVTISFTPTALGTRADELLAIATNLPVPLAVPVVGYGPLPTRRRRPSRSRTSTSWPPRR